jgi:hypothetical protein
MTRQNNFTTGRIYEAVIEKVRALDGWDGTEGGFAPGLETTTYVLRERFDAEKARADDEAKRANYFEGEVDAVEAILVAAGITDADETKLTNKVHTLVEQRDAETARADKASADCAALRAASSFVVETIEAWSRADGSASGSTLESAVDALRTTLRAPSAGAGWVSPEEHAAALRIAREETDSFSALVKGGAA